MHPLKKTYTVRLAITIQCIKESPVGNNIIFLYIYSISFFGNNDFQQRYNYVHKSYCRFSFLTHPTCFFRDTFLPIHLLSAFFLLTDPRFLLSFHIPKTSFFNVGQHSWRMLRFCTSHAFVEYVTARIFKILYQWATSFPVLIIIECELTVTARNLPDCRIRSASLSGVDLYWSHLCRVCISRCHAD